MIWTLVVLPILLFASGFDLLSNQEVMKNTVFRIMEADEKGLARDYSCKDWNDVKKNYFPNPNIESIGIWKNVFSRGHVGSVFKLSKSDLIKFLYESKEAYEQKIKSSCPQAQSLDLSHSPDIYTINSLINSIYSSKIDDWVLKIPHVPQLNSEMHDEFLIYLNIKSKLPHHPYYRETYLVDLVGAEGRKDRTALILPNYGGDMVDAVNTGKILSSDYPKIFLNVAKELKTLHDSGFTHGDLKLENVLFKNKNEMAIIDFGGSTCEDTAGGQDRFTAIYAPHEFFAKANVHIKNKYFRYIAGTYEDKEKLLINTKTQARDVYALGVMFYLLINYDYPTIKQNTFWDRNHLRRTLEKHKKPKKLVDLVMEMIHPHPNARPSMNRVVEVLTELSGSKLPDLHALSLERNKSQGKIQQ